MIVTIKMTTKQLYTIPQRNLLLLGSLLVIVGSFLPWEIEGDFISTWRYGVQFFPVFADNGGILVLLLSIFIIGLVFRSEGFIKSPAKGVLISAIALFIVFAYHIADWLVRRIASYGMVGAPSITIGLYLVGIGSILLLATAFFVNSKVSANYVQK
jgi:hypothetical protein